MFLGVEGGVDRVAQAAFFSRAVAVPAWAPDAVQFPAETPEDGFAEAVAVARDAGGVIHGSVAFDADEVPAGMLGVSDGEVDPVTGGADLRKHVVTPGAQRPQDRLFKRAFRVPEPSG